MKPKKFYRELELELELIQTQMTQNTEAIAAGRSGNARALRKQSKCGVVHEGEGHWPKFSQKNRPSGGAQKKIKKRGICG